MVLTLAAHILKVEQYRKDPLHKGDTQIHKAFHISVNKNKTLHGGYRFL